MRNRWRNLRRSSWQRFLLDSVLYAAAIYGFIHLRSTPLEVVQVDRLLLSSERTAEAGVYLNDYHLPLDRLESGKIYSLPFNQLGGESLDIDVDSPHLRVEVLNQGKILEHTAAILDPTGEGRDGKDGLSLHGASLERYVLRITQQDGVKKKEFLVRFR